MGALGQYLLKRLLEKDKKQKQQDIAPLLDKAATLSELEAATRDLGPGPTVQAPGTSDYVVNLPKPTFTPRDALERSSLLKQAGLDESKLATAQDKRQRTSAFQDIVDRFTRGEPVDARQADFLNNKTLAPIAASGGATYSRYDPSGGVLDQTSAIDALAAQREAKRREIEQRTNAIGGFLNDPSVDRLMQIRAVNKNQLPKAETVAVMENGKEVYYDRMPRADGGFDYVPARDDAGQSVQAPDGTTDPAKAREIQYIARVYHISEQEAADIVYSRKPKSASGRWAEVVRDAEKSPATGYGRRRDKVTELARQSWEERYPGEPVPSEAGAGGGSNTRDDAAQRAAAEGYDNLGRWVEGQGWEVIGTDGKVIGYYY